MKRLVKKLEVQKNLSLHWKMQLGFLFVSSALICKYFALADSACQQAGWYMSIFQGLYSYCICFLLFFMLYYPLEVAL